MLGSTKDRALHEVLFLVFLEFISGYWHWSAILMPERVCNFNSVPPSPLHLYPVNKFSLDLFGAAKTMQAILKIMNSDLRAITKEAGCQF